MFEENVHNVGYSDIGAVFLVGDEAVDTSCD